MVNRQTSVIKTFENIFVEDIPHGNSTYKEHCIDVYHILKQSGVDDYICICGLWHSVYGTDTFNNAYNISRKIVSAAIGKRCEEIVYQFCTMPDRTNTIIHNNVPNRKELLWIEYANLYEQYCRHPNKQLEKIMNDVKEAIENMETAKEDMNKFSILGYQPVKELLSSDICSLVTQYALIKELNSIKDKNVHMDDQVPNSMATYGDSLMESILLQIKPAMEYVTGKTLAPTYSYYRVYRGGAELKKHTDRPSCQYSCTVFFGKNYIKNPDGQWNIFMDGKEVSLDVGDAVVYKGMEREHWRDKFDELEFSYHVQGFFHYVDVNDIHAEWAMDKREFIGRHKRQHPKKYVKLL